MSIDYFKRRTLNALLADLARLEKNGLQDQECEKIQGALTEAFAVAAGLEDQSLIFSSFWEQIRQLSELYKMWNGGPPKGEEAAKHRSEYLIKMVKFRREMKLRFLKKTSNDDFREEQLNIADKVDSNIAYALHRTFTRATVDHPQLFPSLKANLEEHEKTVTQYKGRPSYPSRSRGKNNVGADATQKSNN